MNRRGAKVLIAAAPNGAYKTRADHPRLPVTPAQLARDAEQCLRAGAAMLHLHVRDENARHSLHPKHYARAITAIRDAVGDEMLVQTTTESAGKFSLREQMNSVTATGPEAFSLALREFFPGGEGGGGALEEAVGKFLAAQHARGVWMQFILYQPAEVEKFFALRDRGLIPGGVHSFLFVINRRPDPAELPDFRRALNATGETNHRWMACAFNEAERPTAKQAITTGGDMRVGFENNHQAPDNAALVTEVAAFAARAGRPLLSAAELRHVVAP
ncbi:MAG: 3-keto-5-aminohexanoate cleavage protein [Gammaproteobacteria bacterium]|nr:3-keto-5-aminohexanoate cleavage protein [Gammaproteobacteria bacterium]MDD9851095.1 3-keto-5-aminohexanoate cleavage protein [Gammaproteobacteria bacterium]